MNCCSCASSVAGVQRSSAVAPAALALLQNNSRQIIQQEETQNELEGKEVRKAQLLQDSATYDALVSRGRERTISPHISCRPITVSPCSLPPLRHLLKQDVDGLLRLSAARQPPVMEGFVGASLQRAAGSIAPNQHCIDVARILKSRLLGHADRLLDTVSATESNEPDLGEISAAVANFTQLLLHLIDSCTTASRKTSCRGPARSSQRNGLNLTKDETAFLDRCVIKTECSSATPSKMADGIKNVVSADDVEKDVDVPTPLSTLSALPPDAEPFIEALVAVFKHMLTRTTAPQLNFNSDTTNLSHDTVTSEADGSTPCPSRTLARSPAPTMNDHAEGSTSEAPSPPADSAAVATLQRRNEELILKIEDLERAHEQGIADIVRCVKAEVRELSTQSLTRLYNTAQDLDLAVQIIKEINHSNQQLLYANKRLQYFFSDSCGVLCAITQLVSGEHTGEAAVEQKNSLLPTISEGTQGIAFGEYLTDTKLQKPATSSGKTFATYQARNQRPNLALTEGASDFLTQPGASETCIAGIRNLISAWEARNAIEIIRKDSESFSMPSYPDMEENDAAWACEGDKGEFWGSRQNVESLFHTPLVEHEKSSDFNATPVSLNGISVEPQNQDEDSAPPSQQTGNLQAHSKHRGRSNATKNAASSRLYRKLNKNQSAAAPQLERTRLSLEYHNDDAEDFDEIVDFSGNKKTPAALIIEDIKKKIQKQRDASTDEPLATDIFNSVAQIANSVQVAQRSPHKDINECRSVPENSVKQSAPAAQKEVDLLKLVIGKLADELEVARAHQEKEKDL